MKNSIRTVIVSAFLLTLFSCTASTDADVPLPITTSSEEALEMYNKAWIFSWGDHKPNGIKQSELYEKAL